MDVTEQITWTRRTYGSSDNTNPAYNASSMSLNYASGGTWQHAVNQSISAIPSTLKYADSVGLFGAPNYFIKVKCDIRSVQGFADFEEAGWEAAVVSDFVPEEDPYYVSAVVDGVPEFDPKYEGARFTGSELPNYANPLVSVELTNFKTGNIYTDSWLDVRLYTPDREEHPYDFMYIRPNQFFYIGIHARNTKRIPYDLQVVIGEYFVPLEEVEDKRYIMRSRETTNYDY